MSPSGSFQPGFLRLKGRSIPLRQFRRAQTLGVSAVSNPMKLHSHLVALVIACLLPVILFAGVMIYASYSQQRAHIERGMIDTTRALSLAVDRELDASIRTLQVLATSDHLYSGDLEKFYRSAQDAVKNLAGWSSMALMDPSGRQILNLRRPLGTKLPQAAAPEVIQKVIDTKQPVVSNLFQTTIVETPLIVIAVPVMRNGQVQYVLESSTSPAFLATLLSQQKIPPQWRGTIIDNNKIIIARTRNPERYIGQRTLPTLEAETSATTEGWFRDVTHEDIAVYTAFSHSPLTGWILALGIPAAEVEAPLRRTLMLTAIGGLLLLGVGIGLAALLGYRLTRAAAQLKAGARALGTGETVGLEPLRISELDEVRREIEASVLTRAAAEEAVRISEERYRLVSKATQDVIWDWDLITNRVECNDNVTTIFGYPLAEIPPDVSWWFEKIHPADRERIVAAVDSTIAGDGHSWSGEYRYACRNGSYATVLDRGYILRDNDGKALRMIGSMIDITERKRAEEELQKSQERLRGLAAYLQSVREEERTRIARELHDEIGQAVTGIKLTLERAIREPDGVAANAAMALGLANELIGKVRDLSLELRPAMLDQLGLLAGLTWHFGRYLSQVNVRVKFKHAGLEGRRFAPEIETAAYRIVQEALTNVARHAGTSAAEVELEADETMLRIEIRDLGAGFNVDSLSAGPTGGLCGMRERAIMLGGRLEIKSAPGAGTLLIAELPLVPALPAGTEAGVARETWIDEPR
jgi:PAS domain S-box-containing protein